MHELRAEPGWEGSLRGAAAASADYHRAPSAEAVEQISPLPTAAEQPEGTSLWQLGGRGTEPSGPGMLL